MPAITDLACRLRQLREGAGLTQLALGRALGVSVPLISSWEKATPPPERRLELYARLFAVDGDDRQMIDPATMTPEQRRGYDELKAELLTLRREPSTARQPDHPLRFGHGQHITVVCAKPVGYENGVPRHPEFRADHNDAHSFADLDALIALLPLIGALNPTAAVTVGTADELTQADLTDHVIALGCVDRNGVIASLINRLGVPVRQLTRDATDPGGFLLKEPDGSRRECLSHVERAGDQILLKSDVAHFLRAPNPMNPRRTLTLFSGNYSRGTYGIVCALTDPKMKQHNAGRVARHLQAGPFYSVVSRIRVVANEVLVPDWTHAADREHEWTGTAA